ncbi:glycolipid sulfotransferase [soil metagenome]
MVVQPVRYRTSLEDSARWDGFTFRDGDIVISAPSKSGTTWTQMICALLVFQTPDLPAPLTTLSPWLDMRVRPVAEVHDHLAAQPHRRFIKTHTPLDGLPVDERVTYLAIGRDPRDVVLSLRHQGANLRRDVIRRLVGEHDPESAAGPAGLPDEREYVRHWLFNDESPLANLDSLRGLIWQTERAWSRRACDNVVLVHYADLSRDLAGQMRRLADRLGITVPEPTWPALVASARFDRMRERAADLVPDERLGIMRDANGFFRAGTSGAWRRVLHDDDKAAYDARVAALAAPDLAHWLHHGGG